jgi:hypothetical protein
VAGAAADAGCSGRCVGAIAEIGGKASSETGHVSSCVATAAGDVGCSGCVASVFAAPGCKSGCVQVAGAAADGECSGGAGALGGDWPPAHIVGEAPALSHRKSGHGPSLQTTFRSLGPLKASGPSGSSCELETACCFCGLPPWSLTAVGFFLEASAKASFGQGEGMLGFEWLASTTERLQRLSLHTLLLRRLLPPPRCFRRLHIKPILLTPLLHKLHMLRLLRIQRRRPPRLLRPQKMLLPLLTLGFLQLPLPQMPLPQLLKRWKDRLP